MGRLSLITALALFLAVPLWAQRGGGRGASFGGARGFSGGHVGGGQFSGGMRSGVAHGMHSAGFSHGPHWFGNGPHGFHRQLGNQLGGCFGAFCGHPGFGNRFGNPLRNCVGALCGHGFGSPWRRSGWGWGWGWGYYDPWLWSSWDYDDYRFDRDYYRDQAIAQQWNEQNLEEARMLREEEADRDQDSYARRSYSRQSAEPPQVDEQANTTPTVLIFRDQHQKEVTNYAIVGQTLWTFTPQRKEKIALADLDIPATIKANDDRGVGFSVPGTHEGQ